MSSSRSSFVVLSAFLFVCVLALLTGPSIDGLRIRRRLSSSQVAEVNAIPSKNILANVSYSQLQEAVITEYFASHPDETDIEVQFDDALGAMQMVEIDGKPVPINSVDGLYVGSIGKLCAERHQGRDSTLF